MKRLFYLALIILAAIAYFLRADEEVPPAAEIETSSPVAEPPKAPVAVPTQVVAAPPPAPPLAEVSEDEEAEKVEPLEFSDQPLRTVKQLTRTPFSREFNISNSPDNPRERMSVFKNFKKQDSSLLADYVDFNGHYSGFLSLDPSIIKGNIAIEVTIFLRAEWRARSDVLRGVVDMAVQNVPGTEWKRMTGRNRENFEETNPFEVTYTPDEQLLRIPLALRVAPDALVRRLQYVEIPGRRRRSPFKLDLETRVAKDSLKEFKAAVLLRGYGKIGEALLSRK
jgi:hypothetical protein